ncbi:MAG TPA: hypothetical protein VMW80_08320 [Candidatus Dormibacteraeota bacterium]|nr:hypothetical protein [Candidatus Dormibacteraeota bacterium]
MTLMPGFEPRGEVAADDRARVAFGRAGVRGRDRFLVSVSSRGEILLTPVASIPKQELLIWERTDVMTSLLRGLDDYRHGRVRDRDDFLDKDLEE